MIDISFSRMFAVDGPVARSDIAMWEVGMYIYSMVQLFRDILVFW